MLNAEMQELRQLDASFDRRLLYEGEYDSFVDEIPEEAKTCQLCGFVSRHRGRMGYADHAWKHVTDAHKGTAIFRCTLCSAGQATYTGAQSHLRQIHEIGKDEVNSCLEDHRLEYAVAYAHCWYELIYQNPRPNGCSSRFDRLIPEKF